MRPLEVAVIDLDKFGYLLIAEVRELGVFIFEDLDSLLFAEVR